MSTLRSIVDRTYEAFNARSFDAYRELLDEDVELVMSGVRVQGLAAVTDFVSVTAQVRPAMRIEPERVFLEAGDTLVTQVRMTDLPPAGPPGADLVETSACGLYRIRNGRIVEWRVYVDPVGEDMSSAALVAAAAEQSALRRLAELVARQAPPGRVFAAVCEELSQLFEGNLVRVARLEPDGAVTLLASDGSAGNRSGPETDLPLSAGTVVAGSAVEAPIVVEGQRWGAIAVGASESQTLPNETEERVAQFAELLSTAISNAESRATVARLAAEQSALRRIATLVAREYSPDDLFATLAEELGELLGVDAAAILRYEKDAIATVVAGWSDGAIDLGLGNRLPLGGENLAGRVFRTGSAQRKEDYGGATGEIAATVRRLGIRSAVASPIVVEGATWGVIAVLSRKPEPLPRDTEARLAEFSRHAAMAVANAKSRSDLARSRARIVLAGDEARRRFERDLHDGAQQRLVSLGLELRAAEATVPAEQDDLRQVLSGVAGGLRDVIDGLRELSRGLHPAALSEGGLSSALRALVRRSAVPIDLRLDLDDRRFEESVEVAAYYAASEALANSAKHASASSTEVLVAHRDGRLDLIVRDDGKGGADASRGTGLIGLVDRVEAIGGTIQIDSSPGVGTTLSVRLPTGPA
jgi:signal transduction histidine kinase/ketosteroid isomerase-like protein